MRIGVVFPQTEIRHDPAVIKDYAQTAEELGLNPLLTGAANTSGGVMGKMISPQSIAVACAATGLVGEEGNLFRFTFKHAIFLTTVMGVIVALQAYVFPWMIP